MAMLTSPNLFSGTSTPRFDTSNYDITFGTPQDGGLFGLGDKAGDYFSTGNGKFPLGSPYGLPQNFFGSNSPYPNTMDITPPHTAIEPPSTWGFPESMNNQSLDDSMDKKPQVLLEANTPTVKIQHGRTTPPDEAMRAPDMDDLETGFLSAPQSVKRESTSSIKSTKPAKKSKKSSRTQEPNEEHDKRTKFLERNRVAASKCRQKKKEYNGQLEARAKQLERDNAILKMQLESLQTEKINLMTQMALHTPDDCECHQLHQHLESFKAQFSDQPSTSSTSASTAKSSPMRNGSVTSTADSSIELVD